MAVSISEAIDKKALRDILELDHKITLFQSGKMDSEAFRAFRLARGVYGQRQDGVNMIRIKLPIGRVSPDQLSRIADLSDKYGSSNLHVTTRQDIQLHYVKLKDAPQLWASLEEKGITLREACGNTIRNLTASPLAGIDPDEPFDVSPYANTVFKYFLRNPVCQQLGRKFKIAFSSSDKDAAFAFIHDIGLIPKIRTENGIEQRGFKIVLAGGLGAQPFLAHPVFDFIEENQLIPFIEACLRIFDRYGERVKRHKARLKYLINDIGIDKFLELVAAERKAISTQSFAIPLNDYYKPAVPKLKDFGQVPVTDPAKFEKWEKTNVFRQKQQDFLAVQIKLPTGDLPSDKARALAEIVKLYASDDIRLTVNQGIILKYVRENALAPLFNDLDVIGLAEPGFDTLHDITACPGTDTCNLGIASSVGLAKELERMLKAEYEELLYRKDLKIKISGCMNGCGHHAVANIGFHAMSMKVGKYVLPAMQVMLAGGPTGDGDGVMAEKIIKLASKKVPDALRMILNDFKANASKAELFNTYFRRLGKNYFYTLLKPLGEITEITQDFLLDWGHQKQYETLIGIGECAVSMVDMVSIVMDEVKETQQRAQESFLAGEWVESIYYSYTMLVNSAKALLLTKDVPCNTQNAVLNNFDKHFTENGELALEASFKDIVLQISQNEPTALFAESYRTTAMLFIDKVNMLRNKQLNEVM
jgi:sulfite reductase (ferredoxin)